MVDANLRRRTWVSWLPLQFQGLGGLSFVLSYTTYFFQLGKSRNRKASADDKRELKTPSSAMSLLSAFSSALKLFHGTTSRDLAEESCFCLVAVV